MVPLSEWLQARSRPASRLLVLAVFSLTLLALRAASALPAGGIPPPPPVAPAVVPTTFTVTWSQSGHPDTLSSVLQERVAGGSWKSVGSTREPEGRVTLTRTPGVYEYRAREARRVLLNAFEPDIILVFGSAISVTVVDGNPPEPDPVEVQVTYGYEVRAGHIDSNGLRDIYVKRVSGGNPNNGVLAETILSQLSPGSFTVYPGSSASFAAAAAWPLVPVSVDLADYSLDGNTDVLLRGVEAGLPAPGADDLIVISSGTLYDGQAAAVIPFGDSQAKFARDTLAWLQNPAYFDNAGEPDKPGYRITIDVRFDICRDWLGWGFITCITYNDQIEVGEFSLEDLGLDNFIAKSSASTVYAKSSTSRTTASSAVSGKVNQAANSLMTNYNLATLVGTDTQKSYASSKMTAPSDPQTLWCVIWCGYAVKYYYGYGYDIVTWVDRWEPIEIPGTFDDVNFSREAFEHSQLVLNWGQVIKQGAQQAAKTEAARRALIAVAGALGVGAVVEDLLESIYDPESGIPDAATRRWLETMINVLCTAEGISAEECIAIVEDSLLGTGVPKPDGIGGILEDIFGEPGVLGETNPEIFDEDWLSKNVVVFGAALEKLKKPNRQWCSYIMSGPSSRQYFGRTSTLTTANCRDAVNQRFQRHRLFDASWSSISLDRQGPGLAGYSAIRGREQQLIDRRLAQLGVTELRDAWPLVGNRIRGVARQNPLGCGYWLASNAAFIQIAAYTGTNPASCPP